MCVTYRSQFAPSRRCPRRWSKAGHLEDLTAGTATALGGQFAAPVPEHRDGRWTYQSCVVLVGEKRRDATRLLRQYVTERTQGKNRRRIDDVEADRLTEVGAKRVVTGEAQDNGFGVSLGRS